MPRATRSKPIKPTTVEKLLATIPPAKPLSTNEAALIQQRLELNTQLDWIVSFIEGPAFPDINPVQQALITQQMQLMTQLSHVLLMRLDHFETERRRTQMYYREGL